MKGRISLAVLGGLLLALGLIAPAFADDIVLSPGATINKATGGQGGQGGAGGTGIGIGGSAHQQQGQSQGQHQGQAQGQEQGQGQLQGQKQNANNDGNHQSVKFESSLIPGVAVAPGLSSVGTYACLGSVSFGLSGPMAGASFGITKVDKGCEHARDAVIVMGWGYPVAAMILLSKNSDTADALMRDPKAQALLKTATGPVDTTIPDLKLNTPLGEPAPAVEAPKKTSHTDIPTAMRTTLAARAADVQGN